jgi:hypothetical protein
VFTVSTFPEEGDDIVIEPPPEPVIIMEVQNDTIV